MITINISSVTGPWIAPAGPSFRRLSFVAVVTSIACGSPTDVRPGAPVFGTPVTEAVHNRPYVYVVDVIDPDGDPLSVTVPSSPGWLSFDSAAMTLSGTAGWDNVGSHHVSITATDGTHTTQQIFSIEVIKGDVICDQDFGDPSVSEYILPFPEGKTYNLFQGYCPPDPTWGHHDFFAYDFDLTTNDTIVASRAGRVFFMREDQPNIGGDCSGGKENLIFIEHADGTIMSYAHLNTDGSFVETGEAVERGQPIGLSGNSGCSSGPHLHVNLYRAGGDFSKRASLPFNYRNALGPLDDNRGLIQGEDYTAGVSEPGT
jgi:hypothetical protein